MRFPTALHRQGARGQQRRCGLAREFTLAGLARPTNCGGTISGPPVPAVRDIVEWPGGLPGDVGFFLKWGETKR